MNIVTKIARVLWIHEYRAALLRARVFASTEHDRIIDKLGLSTVVDIGANRGQFALCIRRLYPKAKIFSFEPLRKPAATYRKVFRNDERVKLFDLCKPVTDARALAELRQGPTTYQPHGRRRRTA